MRVILKRIQTLLSGVYLIGEVRHCEIRFYEIRHGEIRNGEVHLVNAISPGRISPGSENFIFFSFFDWQRFIMMGRCLDRCFACYK